MKFYRFYLSLALILFGQLSQACDICGCSVGGMYVGILPQFQQHFVGLRYQFREFSTKHIVSGNPVISNDRFHTVELWGRFYPHKRIQMMGFMPVNIFNKKESGRVMETVGQGDFTLITNYIAVNTSDTALSWWKHNLLVGGGLKLPTGEFNHYRNDTLLNPNLQSGTGSWDFLLNAMYTVRYKKVGINIETHGRFTMANVHGYKFGDRVNGALRFFMWTKIKKTSIVPAIGFTVEYATKDKKKNALVLETGGVSASLHAGLDVYIAGKCLVGGSISHAIWDNLGNGMITSGWRTQIQFSYLF